ncbi:MAG: hypothetical protein P1U85_10105 [Verrucomicrobiales bacterium]|jgi:uncharacterized membrane protein YphA (DoxX/SURF4 family)|nr:hypothetical protein [Verrucomicrobiales bacterium]
MPFQPLPEDESAKPHSADLGLLVIRLLAALTFLYYQLIDQLNLVRLYLWENAEWSLVQSIDSLGLPFPGAIAVVSILFLCIAFLGITFGFFTRLNGLIGFLLIGCALFLPLEISKALSPQTLILYLLILLGLAVGGGGKLTLDQYFSTKKKKK